MGKGCMRWMIDSGSSFRWHVAMVRTDCGFMRSYSSAAEAQLPTRFNCRRVRSLNWLEGRKAVSACIPYGGQSVHCWLGPVNFGFSLQISCISKLRFSTSNPFLSSWLLSYVQPTECLKHTLTWPTPSSIEELLVRCFLFFGLVCGFLLCQAKFSGNGCITGS